MGIANHFYQIHNNRTSKIWNNFSDMEAAQVHYSPVNNLGSAVIWKRVSRTEIPLLHCCWEKHELVFLKSWPSRRQTIHRNAAASIQMKRFTLFKKGEVINLQEVQLFVMSICLIFLHLMSKCICGNSRKSFSDATKSVMLSFLIPTSFIFTRILAPLILLIEHSVFQHVWAHRKNFEKYKRSNEGIYWLSLENKWICDWLRRFQTESKQRISSNANFTACNHAIRKLYFPNGYLRSTSRWKYIFILSGKHSAHFAFSSINWASSS